MRMKLAITGAGFANTAHRAERKFGFESALLSGGCAVDDPAFLCLASLA
jgi:hypothetical protein